GDMPAPAAWVLGVFVSSIAVYALVASLEILAATAFAVWAAIVITTAIAVRRGAPEPGLRASELAALALCALATLFWCWDIASASQSYLQREILTTWTDQFAHAGVISQFGDPRAVGHQAIELADVPRPPYHYGSYMLPAALAGPLDLPGLSLATAVWVPLGFLALCAGAYTLGSVLAGPAGGFAALGALTLVPDATSYGLFNRLFGFYWYVLAGPSASYAVGLCLVSFACLHRWHATRDVRLLVVGAAMVLGLSVMRVHVFLLALPAWVTCLVLCLRLPRERKLAVLAAGCALFALFVFAFYREFPNARLALDQFLDVAHNQQEPTGYSGVYAHLLASHGAGLAFPVGVLLVFPAGLGIFLLIYPLAVFARQRSQDLQATDWMPAVVAAWYVLLMVTAPIPGHGDSTEWTQRPFVVLYAVVAVWTAAGLASWLTAQGWSASRMAWSLGLAAALAVPLALNYTLHDLRWSLTSRAARGLPHAAAFIREHWRPGDVLAAQGLKRGVVVTDTAVELVALTGMPAYIARPFVQFAREGRAGEIARERYGALIDVAAETTAPAALARLRRLGIQWYVIADYEGPGWDPERRAAAFAEGTVAVYSARAAP
ncbi:MAG: hypothetical protein JOZ85_14955, partial [Betaproteobacteria bacterium]|nr:hypothetical protein [Betaproteobacteria bacterium]